MGVLLDSLVIDAAGPAGLARFWGGLLRWEVVGDRLEPTDDTGFGFRFDPDGRPRDGLNTVHLHLTSSSPEDQQATVDRVLDLGGQHLDVGQLPEEGHVVLADPEGNEFCVIEPGNRWLADCGFLAELACDGTREVGHFWAGALGWPLVHDEDQETAIRSPHGGPIIAWGGPPLNERTGRNRFRFELVPADGGDVRTEVARLVALGATWVGETDGRVVLADPDGNELAVRGR
jgi:catechol 2,3-dioxygenase-like lactoylglutathione lyase family enzyme